jgi:hypothetical protein
MNKLIFLETIAQVRWFSQNAPQEIRQSTPVAISPNAAYTCKQYGLSYFKIEEYADVSRRLQEVTPIVKRFLELESWLDSWAGQAIPEFAALGFLPASGASFLIQCLFIEIWSTTRCLQEMLNRIRPDEVLFWSPTIIEVPRYIHPNVSPIPAILPSVAHNMHIAGKDLSIKIPNLSPISNFHTLPIYTDGSKWDYARSRLKGLGKTILKQIPSLVNLRTVESPEELIDFISTTLEQKAHVLCSGFHYDLMHTVKALRKHGVRVTVLQDDLPISRLGRYPDHTSDMVRRITQTGLELLREPLVWAPLEEWGITQKIAIWSKPLDFWWNRLVPVLWERYQFAQKILKKKPFDAVLTWDTTGSTLSSAIDNAARTANIPCYIYQHGSSCEVNPHSWQCFLRPYQTFFAYGKGTAEMLEHSSPPFPLPHARIIPVGSARLDALSQQQTPEVSTLTRPKHQSEDHRPTILYIPTMFGGYGRMFDLVAYPDVSYFELLQNILLLWKDFPEVRLLYKDFITENNTDRVIAKFIHEHIPNGTVTYQRLTDLMWTVDAIIVDHVVTAIGEVLLTKKQVLVYMPSSGISHAEARRCLQQRAIVSATPEEFEKQVRLFLERKSYPEVEQPDDEFLRTYCTHLNDGLSAERASAFLIKDLI